MTIKKTLTYQIGKAIATKSCEEIECKVLRKGINYICNEDHWNLTYPILGMLSGSIQERLREKTHCEYNSDHAWEINMEINMPLYAAVAYAISNGSYQQAAIGLGIGLFEGFVRGLYSTHISNYGRSYPHTPAVGSLAGKIISLPLEGILGIYDAIKNKKKGDEK